MTVLMTADATGGIWTHALDLSRGLSERGIRVVLAVMGAPLSIEQRRAASQVSGLTLAARPYRLEWMQEPWADVDAAGEWLLDLARGFKPDVVHVNGFVHAALLFEAPVLVGAHSCVLSWYRAVKRAAPSSEWIRYEQAVRRGLASARIIVAPSRAMAMSLIHHYAPAPPVLVIHNGREPSAYAPGTKEPIILTAGRVWDEAKNVGLVARVAPTLLWPVFVAGEGSHGVRGLTPLGRLSALALAEWFARASIYTLPARYEPFGLSALEAALSGCALVLGDIPSLREIWDDTATFVDPDDGDALGAALAMLIGDDARRGAMARRARARARRYGVDTMTDAYAAVYQQLAAAPAAAIPRRLPCAS